MAVAVTADGVPAIVPLVLLSVNPEGSAGFTLYAVTVPVTVGVSALIASPTTAAMDGWAYESAEGAVC